MAGLLEDEEHCGALPPDFDPAYLSAVDELYHDQWAADKLLRIRWLQRSLAHFWPQGHPTRLIHVAGTNGKGSTCRLLEAGLGLAGPAGAMTNPHLFDYAERCTIHGQPLAHDRIARLWRQQVRPHSLDRAEQGVERCLSFAEAGILLSLLAFAEDQLRWGVVETGVGGRYAPSMAIQPACCVLTNVGHDHPQTLGHCLWQRALEKAGIARADVPLFTAAQGQALAVVQRVAEQEGADLVVVGAQQALELREEAASWRGQDPLGPRRPAHGWLNLALALRVIEHMEPGLKREDLWPRLLQVQPLPGRFWEPRANLVVDVAHNADKLAALASELAQRHAGRPLLLVMGLSRERPLAPLLEPLAAKAVRVVFTSASYAGREPESLQRECQQAFPQLPSQVEGDPVRALALAESLRQGHELVVLTGSAYTIDQALNPNPLLKRMNAEYGRRGGNH